MSIKTMVVKSIILIQGKVIMWRLDKLIERLKEVTDKLNRYENGR